MKLVIILVSLTLSNICVADDVVSLKTRTRWIVSVCLFKNKRVRVVPCYSTFECREQLDPKEFDCIPSDSCSLNQLQGAPSDIYFQSATDTEDKMGTITVDRGVAVKVVSLMRYGRINSETALFFDAQNKAGKPVKVFSNKSDLGEYADKMNSILTECPSTNR